MMLSTAPFVGARPARAGRVGVPRRVVLRCRADATQGEPVTGVKLLAAGLAAAALLNCAPASAGVVFDKKPNVKKVFQNELAPAKAVRAAKSAADGAGISLPSLPSFGAPSLPSFGAPSLPAFKAPSLGLTLGTLAIPAAVVTIGGGFVLLSKLDVGFGAFMRDSVVKDSGDYAGYEQKLQQGFEKVVRAPKKAVKSVAKKVDKEAKKSGFSLPNPFAK